MKTPAVLVSAVVIALSLPSCTMLQEKYARNELATAAYLAEKKGAPARINVEGVWYSRDWGTIVLNQEPGGKLDGVFQDVYHVNGVVTGNRVYLVLIDDDWTEYTAQLTQTRSGDLKGFYSAHVPFSESDQAEILLKRIDH